MSLVLADRVRETTNSTGTGTITLGGAVSGFQSFSVIGNNNTTYYTISGGTQWEVGIGTYYGGTLARTTVISSSTGSILDLAAGSKDVFVTYPAGKSVNQDANNRVLIPYTSGTTNVGSLNVGNATGHTDSGVIAGFTASEPLYLYTSLQNTDSGATSYASYAVNDGGHTAYGELGINNANYSYTAAGFPNNGFSTPLATFVESYGGPLVLGSWDNQKISMVINGAVSTTDAMTINTNGSVAFNGQAGSAGQVLQSNATSAPTWVTPASGTVTSVGGTGTVNGISLSGTVTSSGNLTLGGTLDLSSPPAIGGTTASTGRFTTVTSTIPTGTAPFTVASTTAVANLSIGGNAATVTNGVYTTDTGTVTNTMLAGSIANAKLSNSTITFGSTSQALGSTVSGLTAVTLDNGAVGATTASTGKFTTLESTGTASLATGSTTSIQIVGDASYPQVKATGGTNTPLVLTPLGTGALQAQKTDSAATGGNARGANATDWQTLRSTAAQVASGAYANIGGGQNNTVGGANSVVAGGITNSAGGTAAVVAGGGTNTASGERTFIGGGNINTAAGYYNIIGGGYTNSGTSNSAVTTQSATMNGTTAVTLSGSNASIKVGQYITGTSIANFTYVAAISGTALTLSQAASGSSTSTLSFFTPHGIVVGGGNNQATGSYSFIGGGGDAGTAANRNLASGDWSVIMGGRGGTTRGITGYHVFPACSIPIASGAGYSQSGLLVVGKQTTDATATVITSDVNAGSATNQIALPVNSAYFFKGEVIAGVTAAGDTKGWSIEGVIKRATTAASTALVGTPTVTSLYGDAGASTWSVAVTADTTNAALKITVTGQASTTIRWVAQIRTTEMTY
jgi:hypothetical protein